MDHLKPQLFVKDKKVSNEEGGKRTVARLVSRSRALASEIDSLLAG